MTKYKIAWLPGDGIGNDVMEAAKIVLEAMELDANYIAGDVGWEFWKKEGIGKRKETLYQIEP